MIELIRRLVRLQTASIGRREEGSTVGRCFWVPVTIAVPTIVWVAKWVKRWIKKCKWPWKIFCWIVGFILVLVWVAIVVITTIVIWVFVCDLRTQGEEPQQV